MFTNRIKLFSLFGLPIYLDLSWFLVVVLITWSLAVFVFPHYYEGLSPAVYWGMGLAGTLGLFASIVAHELGHCLVARQFHVPMRGITLFVFGGVAEMGEAPPHAKAEFFVAIAGPVVSLVIGTASYALAQFGLGSLPAPVTGVMWYLAMVNGMVVAFNLVPAFPLDGGRVLRSLLWHIKGNLTWATRITSNIGAGFGIVLMVLGAGLFLAGDVMGGVWQFLLGMFLRRAAQMSYQQVVIRRALEGEPIERFMHQSVATVAPTVTVSHFVEDYVYKYHHKSFPVIDGDHLEGCVTTRDVQKVPRDEWDHRRVQDIASPCSDDNSIAAESDAMQALSRMNQKGVSRLMVVSNDHLEGILSLKDLLKFISLKVELQEGSGRNSPKQLSYEGE